MTVYSKFINLISFSKDFIISSFSIFISTALLHFFLFPQLASNLTIDNYGISLTVIAIVNILTSTFGSELGYTRMIQDSQYKIKNFEGDFTIIVIFASLYSVIMFLIILNFSIFIDSFSIVLSILLIVITILKAYIATEFRLNLSYYKILLTSLFTSLGYLIGGLLISYNINWIVPFLLAEFLSLVFVIFNTRIWKEKVVTTPLFFVSIKIYFFLLLSAFLNSTLNYLDRIIIFPLLGFASVSIYATSSLIGKFISLIFLPMSGVFLSYLIRGKFNVSLKNYYLINILVVLFSLIFIAFTFFFGEFLTGLLYPDFLELSRPFIFLANIGSLVSIIPSINRVIVLKIAPTYWQIIMSITGIVL